MAETPKQFIKRNQLLGKMTKYGPLLSYLEKNQQASLTGYVERHHRFRYVHERSTSLELNADGFADPDTGDERPEDSRALALVDDLEKEMADQIVDLNRAIYNALEKEYEYLTSEEQIVDSLDANEMHFDEEDGRYVDLSAFVKADQLPPAIQKKVVAQYVDLFDRTPEQVLQALVARDIRFDARGNRVDVSVYKKASDLPPDVKEKVLEKYHDWNVSDGFEWWDSVYEMWKEDLAALGFNDPDISFTGFWSQGDGASFTSKSIDIPKYIRGIARLKVTEAQAQKLAERLLQPA